MEYGDSIIMFCLSAGILLYALLIRFGGYSFIPRNWYTKPKDKKAYAIQFAKILAFVAIAPAVSGFIGLAGEGAMAVALVVLLGGFVALLIIGIKFFWKNEP